MKHIKAAQMNYSPTELTQMIANNNPFLSVLDISSIRNPNHLESALDAMSSNKVVRVIKIDLVLPYSTTLYLLYKMIFFNKTLKFLDLSRSSLKDRDVVFIASSLRNNSTLLSLNLSNNEITSSGGEKLALALTHNNTLAELNLSGNETGVASANLLDSIIYTKQNIISAQYFCSHYNVRHAMWTRYNKAEKFATQWRESIAIEVPIEDFVIYQSYASQIAFHLYKADINLGIKFEEHLQQLSHIFRMAKYCGRVATNDLECKPLPIPANNNADIRVQIANVFDIDPDTVGKEDFYCSRARL